MALLNSQPIHIHDLPLVLQLNVAGDPQRWITFEKASYYTAKKLVAWTANTNIVTLFGGTSRITGKQSTLTMDTIIAVRGKMNTKQLSINTLVPLTNKTLFRRDRHVCAYCGDVFLTHDLTRDHIIPSSQGGPNTWMNVITACSACNKKKDARTPEQANMHLLYVPYIPNRAEYLILQNRKILMDQMEFLLARAPKESRLHVD